MSPTPPPILNVSGLAKSFGGVRAVKGIDFCVAPGQILAMIGPNGAGKSTCFNMLNGQIRPDAGRVTFDGHDITGLPPRRVWRLGIGRTFQITATFGSMTVIENVQMALLSHRRRLGAMFPAFRKLHRAEALDLLDRVGMRDQADRACAILAYGDLKRVELAIALSHAPRLLLMDEPTAGMAPGERTALMKLTVSLVREQGIGILFTEHDMDVVFGHADRVLVLDRGAVIAEGMPEEIRADARVQQVYLGTGLTFGHS